MTVRLLLNIFCKVGINVLLLVIYKPSYRILDHIHVLYHLHIGQM